jgi:hypothetical protein
MKNKYKIIVAVIIFFFSSWIFSDWANFKAGISGKQPIMKTINK